MGRSDVFGNHYPINIYLIFLSKKKKKKTQERKKKKKKKKQTGDKKR